MQDALPKNDYLMSIYEKISKLTTEISLLRQEQENFKEDLQELTRTTKDIQQKLDKYDKRFEKIDNLAAYKGSWVRGFERNWWKIAIVVTPVVIGIFELGIWLKNLPSPPL